MTNFTNEQLEAACKALWKHRDEKAELITACDAMLDWADANARAFTIETAPIRGLFLAWNTFVGEWEFMTSLQLAETEERHFTHWRPLPPPPFNPPLPEPIERLGEVLRRVKGTT